MCKYLSFFTMKSQFYPCMNAICISLQSIFIKITIHFNIKLIIRGFGVLGFWGFGVLGIDTEGGAQYMTFGLRKNF